MKFRKETQEVDGWQVSFKNNVHMYCHHLEVAKGGRRYNLQCEDTPAGHIGIWLMDLELEKGIRDEIISILTKFFDGLRSNYKIYKSE